MDKSKISAIASGIKTQLPSSSTSPISKSKSTLSPCYICLDDDDIDINNVLTLECGHRLCLDHGIGQFTNRRSFCYLLVEVELSTIFPILFNFLDPFWLKCKILESTLTP